MANNTNVTTAVTELRFIGGDDEQLQKCFFSDHHELGWKYMEFYKRVYEGPDLLGCQGWFAEGEIFSWRPGG